MGWLDDSRRREAEQREWVADVDYYVWHAGGNPDAVDYDSLAERHDAPYGDPWGAAKDVLAQQRKG